MDRKYLKNKNRKIDFFIYLLKEGEFKLPKGIKVILNIKEFSDSSSESS